MVKQRGKNLIPEDGEKMDPSGCDDMLIQNASVYMDPYHGSVFLKRLYEMYLGHTLCDVILCVDQMEIHAHKMVLATNSPYFEMMFTASFMESVQERVLMREVRYEVLKGIVEYCYTGSLVVNGTNSLELLSIANMFQFEGIKDHCEAYLKQNLDASNCLNIVTFADLHTCQSLKETAEQYSRINFLEVVKSQDFLDIPYDQLRGLLSNDCISVASEKDVFEAVVTWVSRDEENRKQYFTELFEMVRLVQLPAKVLVDSIEKHRYTQECEKSLKLINEVKTYQLLPSHRETLNVNTTVPRMNQLDRHIYLVGGETRSQVFEQVECFSFAESIWRTKADLSSPRDGLGIACYDGNIFVAGGYDGTTALATCECYQPEKNSWKPTAPMANPRHAFSMSELQGWLYVAGGSNFASVEYNTAERYDPIRDEWYQLPNMSNKREGLTMISDENVVYAIGGENGFSILNTVEKYDPRVGQWYNCAPMGYRRRYFGAAVLNNRIYCVGGSDYEDDLNTVESFDARANRWIPIPSMSRRRESVAVVVAKDKLFALGGACRNKETDTVEVFDPQMNRWEPFCSMRRAKEGMGVVVL